MRVRNILKHKFGAIKCERNNIKFPSKLERACYDVLERLKDDGIILFFLRQVPFDLPGGLRHQVDYCIFTKENVIFIESKGRDLPVGKMKRKQSEDLYQIDIHVVKKAIEVYEVVQTYG